MRQARYHRKDADVRHPGWTSDKLKIKIMTIYLSVLIG
jgi:hypothetical protein